MEGQTYILQGNLFHNFLEESADGASRHIVTVGEGRIEERDSSFPK